MQEEYWVLMSKYLTNEITLEEADELLKWIDKDPERVELLQQLQHSLKSTAAYDDTDCTFDTQMAWEKVSSRIDNSLVSLKPKVHYLNWVKYAAIFLLFLNLAWFSFDYYNNNKIVEVSNTDIAAKEIVLPDGSKVWLNNGGKLSYRNGINDLEERRVSLIGEAFFDVKRNPEKPFLIGSSGTVIQVLGTSFNVKNLDDEVTVAVFTGKVSFKALNDVVELVLLPGEKGVFIKSKGLIKSKYENKNFMFWKDQKLDFNDMELAGVLPIISSVYDVHFSVLNDSLKHKRITSSFHKQSLSEVLAVLEFILDTKIEKAENVYVVK